MKPRVCICCGESIAEQGNALSRNPNICASCSSLADGMDEPSISSLPASSGEDATSPENPASSEDPVLEVPKLTEAGS